MFTTNPFTLAELRNAELPTPNWMWDGFIRPKYITILTAQWKSGKSTLLSHLMHRMHTNGHLLGRKCRPARTTIFSEEHGRGMLERDRLLPMDPGTRFWLAPFEGAKPSPNQWKVWKKFCENDIERNKTELLVIDTLASLMPSKDENSVAAGAETIALLRGFSERGLGVLVMHHPRKGSTVEGQSARGSGFVSGAADVLLEMRSVNPKGPADRRRRLKAHSRFPETPRHTLFEWNEDMLDYTLLSDDDDPDCDEGWHEIRRILAESPEPLDQAEILARLPQPRPHRTTLLRKLNRSRDVGLLAAEGEGLKGDPLRYRLEKSSSAMEGIVPAPLDPFAPLDVETS